MVLVPAAEAAVVTAVLPGMREMETGIASIMADPMAIARIDVRSIWVAGLIMEIAWFRAIGSSLIPLLPLLPLIAVRFRGGVGSARRVRSVRDVGSVFGSAGGNVTVSYAAIFILIIIPALVPVIGGSAMLLALLLPVVAAAIAFVLPDACRWMCLYQGGGKRRK